MGYSDSYYGDESKGLMCRIDIRIDHDNDTSTSEGYLRSMARVWMAHGPRDDGMGIWHGMAHAHHHGGFLDCRSRRNRFSDPLAHNIYTDRSSCGEVGGFTPGDS